MRASCDAVPEAADLGLAVGARAIADRQLDDLQVLLGGAEEQVEVAERIEVAEEAAVGGDALVVAAEEHLGAAQRVLESLLEDRARAPGRRTCCRAS